jgi:hypothetical protein
MILALATLKNSLNHNLICIRVAVIWWHPTLQNSSDDLFMFVHIKLGRTYSTSNLMLSVTLNPSFFSWRGHVSLVVFNPSNFATWWPQELKEDSFEGFLWEKKSAKAVGFEYFTLKTIIGSLLNYRRILLWPVANFG